MSTIRPPTASRRRLLLAGAGTAGAVAAAAVVAPLPRDAAVPVAAEKKGAPEPSGGYQVTAHVLRYYDTARV